jgi:DNA polymerase I-like protein with 3'-5' exonuclease and polymerase domains
MQHKIITSEEDFARLTFQWTDLVACDVETALDTHLLGVSLAPENVRGGVEAVYIPLHHFDHDALVFRPLAEPGLVRRLKSFLLSRKLIGHNFTYDKRWLDQWTGGDTQWVFCTRIGFHLASAPAGPRPYSLEQLQEELLGKPSHKKQFETVLKAAGGSARKGEHYKADLNDLGGYACVDVADTMAGYKKLLPWFEQHEYLWMMDQMMSYNLLLERNTTQGILVDVPGLQSAHDRLSKKRDAAAKRFHKLLQQEITSLEDAWKDRKVSAYKREYNKLRYTAHPELWERFNLNSDKDKRELFFDVMGMPVVDFTDAGLPSTGADNIKQAMASCPDDRYRNAIEAHLTYEKANTLTSYFSGPYLASVRAGRLHPGFNICGTVSYRLSGFKPYLLNAPFDEKSVLRHLRCDPGYTGVHADLAAIEPTITAHYSEDPSLLKVFRDGLGDIYLDLALELFPNDAGLQSGYNPFVKCLQSTKEKFAKQRKVAKVIQLAVGYTGTKYTVAKNLTKDGFPTSEWEAERLVNAYWRKFAAVERWNNQLREQNRAEGHLRNVMGRIIRVPDPEYKDLPNRFVQSSGHDVLVLWVLRIYELCKERGIAIKPVLLDCHDSTSNQCPTEQVADLEKVYIDALADINKQLGLCVTVKMEMKRFTTLAGLKAEE